MLDPNADEEADSELLIYLHSCLKNRIKTALITGTSLKTLQTYLLNPLRALGADVLVNNLYAYTENGCFAYYYLDKFNFPVEIPDYKKLVLDEEIKTKILEGIEKTFLTFGFDGHVEYRTGQINYYCNLSRERRNYFATILRKYFDSAGLHEINIEVPTAKEVIDISLGNKIDSITDFMKRNEILKYENMIFISDSLQVDGSDADLFEKMPNVNAFHVGPVDAPICDGVVMIGDGPQGACKILNYVSKMED